MAFKSVKEYNDEKYNGLFILPNDGDTADVIFLYQSENDALIADTHYIKSDEYNGYVHCQERGCPACAKGIRIQTKIFIPLFNITKGAVEFWDRSKRFESQLQQDIFSKFPNPSEYVFRITRHGAAGSMDTTYQITAIGKNTYKSFAQICSENHLSFPEYFETICKDMPVAEMSRVLSSQSSAGGSYSSGGAMPDYPVTPRVTPPAVSPDSCAEPPAYLDPDADGMDLGDGFPDEPSDNEVPEIPEELTEDDTPDF